MKNDALPTRQMESIKLDNLLINFTTEFQRIFDTKNLRSSAAGFWRPPPAPDVLPGYFPLGDLAIASNGNINGAIAAAVVCESGSLSVDSNKGNALSRPDDFERVRTDAGSGATTDSSIWRPIPPVGYVAMGLACSNDLVKPLLNAVRCVRADLVVASNVGDLIWKDEGKGATQNFSAWHVDPPTAAAGEIYFAPGTFFGFQSYTKPAIPLTYALRMPISHLTEYSSVENCAVNLSPPPATDSSTGKDMSEETIDVNLTPQPAEDLPTPTETA